MGNKRIAGSWTNHAIQFLNLSSLALLAGMSACTSPATRNEVPSKEVPSKTESPNDEPGSVSVDETDKPVPPPPSAALPFEKPNLTVRGILDCPTVDRPAYTRASAAKFSEPFSRSCGTCHGSSGQGTTQYPPIPGKLSLDEFKKVVREGRKAMPAFAADAVSDANLASDYALLTGLSAEDRANLRPSGDESTWSSAQVEDAYRNGLVAWRKPDHDGIACANCHTPDAIDLAVIGYTDDAILRRAGKHIPLETAAAVVDFVHAQRRRFGIDRPCARSWRPLQPGGEVLPGNTPQEQDASFAQVLIDRKYAAVLGAVASPADTAVVYKEMVATSLRKLPIGIAMPRWTEDGFNGADHSTINDYMMGLGRVPNDPKAFYELEDKYIKDPTEANLYPLIRSFVGSTNDFGYAEKNKAANATANGRCGEVRNLGGFYGVHRH